MSLPSATAVVLAAALLASNVVQQIVQPKRMPARAAEVDAVTGVIHGEHRTAEGVRLAWRKVSPAMRDFAFEVRRQGGDLLFRMNIAPCLLCRLIFWLRAEG